MTFLTYGNDKKPKKLTIHSVVKIEEKQTLSYTPDENQTWVPSYGGIFYTNIINLYMGFSFGSAISCLGFHLKINRFKYKTIGAQSCDSL